MTIANISQHSQRHVFIVANIVDAAIIGADFMITHGINLSMGQQVINGEMWRYLEGSSIKCMPEGEENRLWIVEPAEI